ncbi:MULTISPECIES: hypothetical protein [unclassified Streptomyces]|uniref:hypothetical protein n=1 Tax=unclassified Streptomyces TaxID=2593676 RepID=UPI003684B886
MTAHAFNPDTEFATPPLYTLKLTAAQRCVLDWIERHGGLFAAITVPVPAGRPRRPLPRRPGGDGP